MPWKPGLEILGFLLLLLASRRWEGSLPPWALGVWLNFLWFAYQNEWGSGAGVYLRGLGLGLLLAVARGERGLAWALTPWPLLLQRLDPFLLLAYLPPLGEGLLWGLLLYLLGLLRR